MHWSDSAIILAMRRHGETSAIIRAFAKDHGVVAGVLKGAFSKSNRGMMQIGNLVGASWSARLSEHMGTFKFEPMKSHAAFVMQDETKLLMLTAVCALLEQALPERHPYPKLYDALLGLLSDLASEGVMDHVWRHYIEFELLILAETGYGLDLSCCAATGATEDLIYVSPKSGRAVSKDAGEPYKNRLLKLPQFLIPSPALAGEGQGGGISDNEKLKQYARSLRKGMTDEEHKLWYRLRAHRFVDFGFRRQKPIGKYIVDFVCMQKKLVVELDGGQHTEQIDYDQQRTAYLESQGYRVIRFWNHEINQNFEDVVNVIYSALNSLPPSLTLPPSGRGNSVSPLAGNEGVLERGMEIKEGLALTGYFLEHWLLEPHAKKMPPARIRLQQILYKAAESL